MIKRAVHFVGFRGDEFNSAVKIWGKPDFFHRDWDVRVKHGGEFHPDDIVIFAKKSEHDQPNPQAFNDSAHF